MNQRVLEAMESIFKESDRDEVNLILDRNPQSLLDGCEEPIDSGARALRLNLLAVITINAFIKLPDLRLETTNHWIQRRKVLTQAIRDVFWIEDDCKFLPSCDTGVTLMAHREQHARVFLVPETALAAEAGVLTAGETARSLATTMRIYHKNGLEGLDHAFREKRCPLVTCMVARAYAGCGFPGHAMEMLRDAAERALREGGFCLGCPQRKGLKGSGHFRSAAALFLNALHQLGHAQVVAIHPMSHHFAPPNESQPISSASAFGRVTQRHRFSFKPIPYEEKRELVRLAVEFPLEFHVKERWLQAHKTFPGGALHPSEAGLAIESKKSLEEGSIVEIAVQAEQAGEKDPFKLRGRVRWCKPKVVSKLFLAGVELDARSKDLKRWRAFIKKHTPEKQGRELKA